VLYFGSFDKHVYAVTADEGRLLWKFATGDMIIGSPVACEDGVYFGSWDCNFYAFTLAGKEKWRFQTSIRSPCPIEISLYKREAGRQMKFSMETEKSDPGQPVRPHSGNYGTHESYIHRSDYLGMEKPEGLGSKYRAKKRY
jgi:hypothetical protein